MILSIMIGTATAEQAMAKATAYADVAAARAIIDKDQCKTGFSPDLTHHEIAAESGHG